MSKRRYITEIESEGQSRSKRSRGDGSERHQKDRDDDDNDNDVDDDKNDDSKKYYFVGRIDHNDFVQDMHGLFASPQSALQSVIAENKDYLNNLRPDTELYTIDYLGTERYWVIFGVPLTGPEFVNLMDQKGAPNDINITSYYGQVSEDLENKIYGHLQIRKARLQSIDALLEQFPDQSRRILDRFNII